MKQVDVEHERERFMTSPFVQVLLKRNQTEEVEKLWGQHLCEAEKRK